MEMTLANIDLVAERIVRFSEKQAGGAAVVLALSGDLGAGKTTLVQAIAKNLGVKDMPLSPTFVLMKTYDTMHQTFTRLVHIDAYRIESVEEFGPLKLERVFGDPNALVCIEWPERLEELLPQKTTRINLSLGEGDTRILDASGELEACLQTT